MSEYCEESIRRKLMQRRIVEVRAANNTKKRTEGQCYWPMYGPERSVYETHYVGQVFNQE